MTKFDLYVENLAAERRERRYEALNERLQNSLTCRTREEVLAELYEGLTFVVGVANVLRAEKIATEEIVLA